MEGYFMQPRPCADSSGGNTAATQAHRAGGDTGRRRDTRPQRVRVRTIQRRFLASDGPNPNPRYGRQTSRAHSKPDAARQNTKRLPGAADYSEREAARTRAETKTPRLFQVPQIAPKGKGARLVCGARRLRGAVRAFQVPQVRPNAKARCTDVHKPLGSAGDGVLGKPVTWLRPRFRQRSPRR